MRNWDSGYPWAAAGGTGVGGRGVSLEGRSCAVARLGHRCVLSVEIHQIANLGLALVSVISSILTKG